MHIYVDGSYNPQTAHWGGGAAILDDEETEVLHTIQVTDFDSNGSRQINGELASSIISLEYVLIIPINSKTNISRSITIIWESRNGRQVNGLLEKMYLETIRSELRI